MAREEKAFGSYAVDTGEGVELNVRSRAAKDGKVLRTLRDGTPVEAAPASRNWMELADGGFAMAKYLAPAAGGDDEG